MNKNIELNLVNRLNKISSVHEKFSELGYCGYPLSRIREIQISYFNIKNNTVKY